MERIKQFYKQENQQNKQIQMAMKKSPSKSRVQREMEQRKTQNIEAMNRNHHSEAMNRNHHSEAMNRKADFQKYFCHYNNAVYMGGMSSFKKHGKGIVLHDDGSAIISEYMHDTPIGHNIVFRENSISSLIFHNNFEYETVYKISTYLMKVNFNAENRPVGNGLLIDYHSHKIYQLVFKNGKLIEKILMVDRQYEEEIFQKNSLTRLIGLKHEQAFNFTFQKPEDVHIKMQKNKFTIGFFNSEGHIHGLAFHFYLQNYLVNSSQPLYLKPLERGFYHLSQLHNFGEKYFSNGNRYIGQFASDEFSGYGVLLCPSEMKWIYGKFHKSKLNQVLHSNNKHFTDQNFVGWMKKIRQIHRRHREKWIDFDIFVEDEFKMYELLKQARDLRVNQVSQDYQELKQMNEQSLSKIQQNFQNGNPRYVTSIVDEELEKHLTFNHAKHNQESLRSHQSQISKSQIRDDSQYHQPKNVKLAKSRVLHEIDERQYRQDDPFKIQLIKIASPLNSDNEGMDDKNQVELELPHRQNSPKSSIRSLPVREHISDSNPLRRSSPSRHGFVKTFEQKNEEVENNYKRELQSSIQKNKDREIIELMRREREAAYFIEQQEILRERQRREIQAEIYKHQNRPSKISNVDFLRYETQSQLIKKASKEHYDVPRQEIYKKYESPLTNKRHFNYKDPSELISHKWKDEEKSNKYSSNSFEASTSPSKYYQNYNSGSAMEQNGGSKGGRSRNKSPKTGRPVVSPVQKTSAYQQFLNLKSSNKDFIQNNYSYFSKR